MIRTQVYLPDKLHRELKLVAQQKKTSLSELIRRGAEKVVQEKAKESNTYAWLDEITGMVKGGPTDTSKNMNYYLYDQPYRSKKDDR